MTLDVRVNACRPDLAAASLKGKVEASRFVEGRAASIAVAVAALRARPSQDSGRETELLFGESVTVFEEKDGWAWVQANFDSYVGYVPRECLGAAAALPTHRIIAPLTPLLPAPDVKAPARLMLPMNAKLHIVAEENRFAKLDSGDYVFAAHLAPLAQSTSDWVAVAESFCGVPYLWGGKTWSGSDCSGLIQTALERVGIASPRDTDMMEKDLGENIAVTPDLSGLMRGDLVFWKGHVGVMTDAVMLLHANAFHMQVVAEPLAAAQKRIAPGGGAIRSIRRL